MQTHPAPISKARTALGRAGVLLLALGLLLVVSQIGARLVSAAPPSQGNDLPYNVSQPVTPYAAACSGPGTNGAYPDNYNSNNAAYAPTTGPNKGVPPGKCPTRCLDTNRNKVKYDDNTGYIQHPDLLVTRGYNLPINNMGVTYPLIGIYPSATMPYPTGCLVSYPSPANIVLKHKAGDTVQFPGWPLQKGPNTSQVNAWKNGGPQNYYSQYARLLGGSYTPATSGPGVNSSWTDIEIHHVMPQAFGCKSDFNNMVPLQIRPVDQHGFYSKWWRSVTADPPLSQ